MSSVQRRRRWFAAGAVVAVVAAGVGGYAFGAARTHRLDDARWLPLANADEDGSDQGNEGFGDAAYAFHQDGLSTEPAVGAAWAYDASNARSQDAARRLAVTLGVLGTVEDLGGAYQITDAADASVTLYLDEEASFSYVNPANDPWLACAGDDGSVAGDEDGCVPSPPSAETAISATRELVASLGVDTETLRFTVDTEFGDDGTTWVAGALMVDGHDVEPSWQAAVTRAGVQSLSGPSAPLIALGEYPLISPAEAVQRLGDRRFAPIDTVWVEPYDLDPQTALGEPPPAGEAVPWQAIDVSIVSAQPVHATVRANGVSVVAPAYELTDDRGNTWSVIAVAEDALTVHG